MQKVPQIIETIRVHDRELEVFGAKKHQYLLSRVAEQELLEFEQLIGIRLPKEYRTFLFDNGCGAGPYYGLMSPHDIREELDPVWIDCKNEGLAPPSPAGHFPIIALPGNEPGYAPFPCSGTIPIADQGCTSCTVLVTSGIFEGTVWDVNYFRPKAEYKPACCPPGLVWPSGPVTRLPIPPTFLQWYDGWVARCLADLNTAEERTP